MDRYQKVEKPKVETPIDENEIRITSQGRMRSYITYAMTLLQEKGSDEVVFKAMGRAINKTVTIVELIKRRIVGLHQITSIQSTDITDTWEPLEEGLQILETTRKVSMVTITLSKKDLDLNNVGYQPPIPADQVKVSTELEYEGGEGSPMGRGRGRGGRGRGRPRGGPAGNGYAPAEFDDGGYDRSRGYPRGRGRGRGRNFRGRGRGGYYQSDAQNDAGGRGGRGGYYQSDAQYESGGRGGRGGYYQSDAQYESGGRGGRGGYYQSDAQNDAGGYNQDAPRYNQDAPRGRGRGRGFRGRGRGFRPNGPAIAATS
ncbi:hypothetical protein SASPL_113082 [Salvia splendens]|uniref:DNA/RNA-binding protein Alba-like domain-containing protein n=1 Tax=Salvia splendens TaxID=180675 RepID=A0A8X8Y112_SALSN|nr:heterogeneous nuclear ribonucleoprotein 87F-like [Salvia splendens]KAG6422704.1 hypothetical protein SASPL_113082 [Salvia splendens]